MLPPASPSLFCAGERHCTSSRKTYCFRLVRRETRFCGVKVEFEPRLVGRGMRRRFARHDVVSTESLALVTSGPCSETATQLNDGEGIGKKGNRSWFPMTVRIGPKDRRASAISRSLGLHLLLNTPRGRNWTGRDSASSM